ncbi:hypothetical protein [Streptomyces sp. NPDC002845]
MRAIRAVLVGASALTVTLGTVTASQAMGWERPWAAHAQSSTLSPASGDGHEREHEKGKKGKGNRYQLIHSCKGHDFGFCTQKLVFAPKIIGDIGLTTGLIGLVDGGDNGVINGNGEPEWCSPGFWFNQGILQGRWQEAGFDPATPTWSDLPTPPYSDTLARTQAGIDAGAPEDPRLVDIWDPQNANEFAMYYVRPRGEVLNDIADALSDAHPDINFTGERVNNCDFDED